MKLCLAATNPTVGHLERNGELLVERMASAHRLGADLVAFPELAICGYPPRDLLLEQGFVERCEQAADQVAGRAPVGLTVVIGCPARTGGAPDAWQYTNSLFVYRDGRRVARYDKRLLPTYDVFDEDRYFVPGSEPVIVDCAGTRVGLAICEDLWRGEDVGFGGRYEGAADPVTELVDGGAQVILAPSASPFVLGKSEEHERILAGHARRHGVIVASVNQLGGNDDLVFDGRCLLVGPDGRAVRRTVPFEPELVAADMGDGAGLAPRLSEAPEATDQLIGALVLGTRDYLAKTGFRQALLGLSGGIDSAVTAALAVAALGAENVLGVSMPGRYSTGHSRSDAADLADRLGMRLLTIPIGGPYDGFRAAIDPALGQLGQAALGEQLPDVADENLQSRSRGTVLMTLSNRLGAVLLTTGNKSELAVGYCTLYGDMNGGLAVISDVPKLQVYEIARRMNAFPDTFGFSTAPIPEATITKPPSAELAPGQLDSDSLPAYDVLDEIVVRHVERRQSAETIVAETGFGGMDVERMVRLIALNEYKRKQAPVGLKVRGVAFGSGRRMPIAQRWR